MPIARASVLLVLLLISTRAFSISRWGNGRTLMSRDQHLVLQLPSLTVSATQVNQTQMNLLLGSPMPIAWNGVSLGLPTVFVDEFSVQYPEYTGLEQDEVREKLLHSNANWRELTDSQNPCLLKFEAVKGDSVTSLLVWGPSSGLVFSGKTAGSAASAIEEMVQSAQLAKECKWK